MAIGTSTSTDPVETVVDILDTTDPGDYANGKPDHVERQEETDWQLKTNRDEPACYVRSPEDGTREQIAPTTTPATQGVDQDQNEVVVVDCVARTNTRAVTLANDVENVLGTYWNDKSPNTEWLRIRPTDVNDRTSESRTRFPNSNVVAVRVELRREKTIGA